MSNLHCSGADFLLLFCFAVTQLLGNTFLDPIFKASKSDIQFMAMYPERSLGPSGKGVETHLQNVPFSCLPPWK